jgi:hypothetical protein
MKYGLYKINNESFTQQVGWLNGNEIQFQVQISQMTSLCSTMEY